LPDLSILEQRFRFKLAERFRLYTVYFKAFTISDAEAARLFGLAGKTFTENDLVLVRKLNRLLDVLNEYTRMRLVVKAFAQERPALYEALNRETAEQTDRYLNGLLIEADYLEARRVAAERLKLNGIVNEAEKRMLRVVSRLKDLGGGTFAGRKSKSVIDLAEDNLRSYQAQVRQHRESLVRLTERESLIRMDRANSGSAEHRAALDIRLRELQRSKLREQADIQLWIQRERTEAENLKKMYVDFVEAYDSLGTFANLRRGRVNSEEVQAFDIPDPFVPVGNEMEVWKEFYDRALYNSTHELVLNETSQFFKAQAGSTRRFVREMNENTGRWFGMRFTDSPLGQEFLQFNRSFATVTVQRMGGILGLSLPSSVGVYYADKLWAYMFTDAVSDDSGAVPGASPSTTPSSTPAAPVSGAPSGSSGSEPAAPRRSGPRGGPIRLSEEPAQGTTPASGPK
jgi:hypothetical protein